MNASLAWIGVMLLICVVGVVWIIAIELADDEEARRRRDVLSQAYEDAADYQRKRAEEETRRNKR